MLDTAKELRKTLPPLLTIRQACEVWGCHEQTIFYHLHRTPRLGVRIGHATRIVRDVLLDKIAPPAVPWTPRKKRGPRAKNAAAKKSTLARRAKQRAAPRPDAGQEGVRP